MEAAVSSSALAWLSVRADKSWLPCAISELAMATLSEPRRTCDTTWARPSFMAASWAIRLVVSPSLTAMGWVKSPPATARATSAAVRGSPPSSRTRLRVMSQPKAAASSKAATPRPMRVLRAFRAVSRASVPAVTMAFFSDSTSAPMEAL